MTQRCDMAFIEPMHRNKPNITEMTQVVEILPYGRPWPVYIQYHGYWWPGDARNQGINSHGIELFRNITSSTPEGLTHLRSNQNWDLNFKDDIPIPIFKWKICIRIGISEKNCLYVSVNNKPIMVQIMPWCWTGDRPLSESMINHFTNASMNHY